MTDITCQNCNQPIPEYAYDWKRLAAECDNCGSWTAFSSTPQQYESLELELNTHQFPDYTDPKYIDFARSLDFKRSEDAVMIVQPAKYKELTTMIIVNGIIAIVCFGIGIGGLFAFFQGGNIPPGLSITALIIGTLSAAQPLNYFLNSNVIMIDHDNVYLSARPYAWLNGKGARSRISGYKQFYVTRKSGKAKGYGLFGIDFQNERREIIAGDERFVLLLESEIEKFLNIKDRPVGGGLSNPYQASDS